MCNICVTCLKDINKLKALYLNKTDDVVKEMKYVLPEISLDPEIPVYMCSTCHIELHFFYIFKKQCLESYGRFTKIIQESGNAENQSFSILQTEIKNIKQENQIYDDITNEASEDVNDQINFMTVEDITDKEDTITLVPDKTFCPGLNKNINEDSDMTNEIEKSECEEQYDQTNISIEDNICIEEDIIKFEDSKESNIYQELLSDIKKENDSEQYINDDIKGNLNQQAHTGFNDFECSICNKKFEGNNNLNLHMMTHTGVKDFECSICDKKFRHKSDLDRHMTTHTRVKDFECSVCNKKFKRNDHLNLHMKTHTGVKDFECSICEKKFTQKGSLNMHMKTHTGVRNFECSICYYKFIRKRDLDMHIKTHTGAKDFECSICKKKFSQKYNLNAHIKYWCRGFPM